MALDPGSLSQSLRALSTSQPRTIAEAAQKWSAAYSGYAADAQSCQAVPPLPASLEASQGLLEASLATAFAGIDPVSTASAMASALTAFWLVPPVAFTGVTPGLVTAVTGATILQEALVANWAANVVDRISAQGAADQIAGLLDAFTRTVVVTHAPPSVCAAPLE